MLKKLLKFSIKSFLIACLFLTLQACTTAKYRSLVSQRSSLQQTYDKDSKNLEVALEEKKKEVAQIEQTLESLQPATASQFEYFSTIFTKELRSLVSNINSFDSYYYNANNSNIYIVNQDINLSSLKEGNLYYITKNLYINSILDKNSVELELPIKILNANGKLQPTTIIIGNHDTRKTRTGVSFQCNITFPPINATGKKLSILEYKGVSADGKSLLFNCINREDYFDNPYKQDAVINFYYNLKNIDLFSEKFYSEKDYKIIIKYLSIVYPTNEVALPSVSYDFEKQRAFYRTLSIDQLKTYTESLDTKEEEFFNSFRGYLISVDSADNSFSLRNINLSQAKESLSKNVNYVKITNFENSIKISLQPVFEISNNLKNQYYLYSKATFELNKLEEATNNIKVSPIGEKISDIDESLKGSCLTKDIYSIFTPSFCNKYTATSRWLLAPYSALGLGFIIVAFPVGIWALVE